MPGKNQLSTTALGYMNEPIPHTFYRAEAESEQAAILLPGRGYICQRPLLYYPMRDLESKDFDVLCVEYYKRPQFTTEKSQATLDCLRADTLASYTALQAERSYKRLVLIGKSLGTLAMAALLQRYELPANTQLIWQTPLLKNEKLVAAIKQTEYPSLIMAGTADPFFSAEPFHELARKSNVESLLIDKANHSLEIPGQVMSSIKIMERVMRAIQEFLDQSNAEASQR